VRSSGTEPLVRVMVEAHDDAIASSIAMELAQALVAAHGGSIEGTH
jgi:phosphomannomutase